MQMTSHLIDFGMTPSAAVAAPRWISGDARRGDALGVVLEIGMPAAVETGLAERGHAVVRVEAGWPHAGYAQIVMLDTASGEVAGGADARAEGAVALV